MTAEVTVGTKKSSLTALITEGTYDWQERADLLGGWDWKGSMIEKKVLSHSNSRFKSGLTRDDWQEDSIWKEQSIGRT